MAKDIWRIALRCLLGITSGFGSRRWYYREISLSLSSYVFVFTFLTVKGHTSGASNPKPEAP